MLVTPLLITYILSRGEDRRKKGRKPTPQFACCGNHLAGFVADARTRRCSTRRRFCEIHHVVLKLLLSIMPRKCIHWLVFWLPESEDGLGSISIEKNNVILTKQRKVGQTLLLSWTDLDHKTNKPRTRKLLTKLLAKSGN